MPALPITLKINGSAAIHGRSIGVSFGGLALNNMQNDIATLRWTRKRATVECPFADQDVVEIFHEDRRLFYGKARLGPVSAEGCDVQILGPWNELEARYFLTDVTALGPVLGNSYVQAYEPGSEWWDGSAWQPFPPTVTWTFDIEASYSGGPTGTVNLHYFWAAKFWLFAPELDGYRTVSEQLEDIFAYLALVTPEDVMTVGTFALAGNRAPKLRTISDIKLAEAIRQTLSSKPDVSVFFDYDVEGVPEIQMKVASLETPLELTSGLRNHQVLNHSLQPLHELVPAGVIVRWEGPGLPYYGGVGDLLAYDAYPSDSLPYSPRVLVQTVAEDVPYAIGIAEEIYDSMSTLRSAGTLRILDRDFSLGLRPGRVIDLAGDPVLSGVQHWVQSVKWDAMTGVATVQCGYPAHLGLRELLDLRGWMVIIFYGKGYLAAQVLPPPP